AYLHLIAPDFAPTPSYSAHVHHNPPPRAPTPSYRATAPHPARRVVYDLLRSGRSLRLFPLFGGNPIDRKEEKTGQGINRLSPPFPALIVIFREASRSSYTIFRPASRSPSSCEL